MSRQGRLASSWMLQVIVLCPLILFGQDNAQNTQKAGGTAIRTPLQINITGCLKKNAETGGYYVSDQNGRAWELSSKKVDLASQVFHTVSVSGHPRAGAPAQEGKSEQKQGNSSQRFALDVTELEMISPSCTR